MKRLTLIRRYCVIFCVFLVFIVHVRCMNMWTSYEGKQTGDNVDKKKSCVSPCRVFHSLCKNDGKCRERTKECTWYCECPENCEGFFCERIIEETDKNGNVEVNIVVEKTKKKPISAFDKSKLTKALANIYTNRLKTSEDKVEKGPASIERVDTSNTIEVKENVTAKVSVYCSPETVVGGTLLKNATTNTPVPEQKENTVTPATLNESTVTQQSKTSTGVKTKKEVDISSNDTNAVNITEENMDNVSKSELSSPSPTVSIATEKTTGKIILSSASPSAPTSTKKTTVLESTTSTTTSATTSTTTKKMTVSTSSYPSFTTMLPSDSIISTKKAAGKNMSTSPPTSASTTTKRTPTDPSVTLKSNENNDNLINVSNTDSKNSIQESLDGNFSISAEQNENHTILSETSDPKVKVTKLNKETKTDTLKSDNKIEKTADKPTTQQVIHSFDKESSSKNKSSDNLTVSNEISHLTPNDSLLILKNELEKNQSVVSPVTTTTIVTVPSTSGAYPTKSVSSPTSLPSTSSSTTIEKSTHEPTKIPTSKIGTTESTRLASKTSTMSTKQPIFLSITSTVLSPSNNPEKTTPPVFNTTTVSDIQDGNSLGGNRNETNEPVALNSTTLLPSTLNVSTEKLKPSMPTPISTTSNPTTLLTSTVSEQKERDQPGKASQKLASVAHLMSTPLPESTVHESIKTNATESINETIQDNAIISKSSKVSGTNTESSTTKILKTETTTADTTTKTSAASPTPQTTLKNENTGLLSSALHAIRNTKSPKEEVTHRPRDPFQPDSRAAEANQRSIKPLVLEPDLASNKLTDKIHKLKDAELDTLKNGLHDIVLKSKNAYDIFTSNKLQPNDREDKLLVGSALSTTTPSV